MQKKSKKYLLPILIILFLLITFGVVSKNPLVDSLDSILVFVVTKISTPALDSFMVAITDIGSNVGTIFIFVIFAIFLFLKKKKSSLYILTLSAASAVVLNETIKLLVERVRPVIRLVTETGFSFPSGHSTISTIFLLSSLLLISPNINNKYLKVSFQILASIVFLLVAFSRIYLSVHFASDVLAGMLLASICFLSSRALISKPNMVA